ncbi:hypothetical protein, partial [Klebsiella pneumoniae]|uniref:hypothetical protein n=1 Tax=Klebsiella pneumoniae TaxID=573 RepID=UPI001C8F3430
ILFALDSSRKSNTGKNQLSLSVSASTLIREVKFFHDEGGSSEECPIFGRSNFPYALERDNHS